jgi:hypothetical protein
MEHANPLTSSFVPPHTSQNVYLDGQFAKHDTDPIIARSVSCGGE